MIGTKLATEVAGVPALRGRGRGALYADRSVKETERGLHTSDNADMSNEKPGGNPGRRNPKISWGRFVRPGLVGP